MSVSKPHSTQERIWAVQGFIDADPNRPGASDVHSELVQLGMEVERLVEQLQTAESERDEWEKRYEELLSAVGGVWPG